VLVNLWIIPLYSWRGAAWASVASDGLLACGVGAAVYFLSRRTRILAVDPEVDARTWSNENPLASLVASSVSEVE
jgi:hypothetical protein